MSKNNVKGLIAVPITLIIVNKYLKYQGESGLGKYLSLDSGYWATSLANVDLGTFILIILILGFIGAVVTK